MSWECFDHDMLVFWLHPAFALNVKGHSDNEAGQLIVSCNGKAFPPIVNERTAQEGQELFCWLSFPISDSQNVGSD